MTAFETPWFLKSKTTEVGRSNQAVEDHLQRVVTDLNLKQRKALQKIDEQMDHVREELRHIRGDVDFSTDLDENGNQIDLEACRSKSTGDVPGKTKDPKHLVNSKGSRSATGGGKRVAAKIDTRSKKDGCGQNIVRAEKEKVSPPQKKITSTKETKTNKDNSDSEAPITLIGAIKQPTAKSQKKKKTQKMKQVAGRGNRKSTTEPEDAILSQDDDLELGTTDKTKDMDNEIDISLLRSSDLDLEIIQVVNRANYALSLPKDKNAKKLKKSKKEHKGLVIEQSQIIA